MAFHNLNNAERERERVSDSTHIHWNEAWFSAAPILWIESAGLVKSKTTLLL